MVAVSFTAPRVGHARRACLLARASHVPLVVFGAFERIEGQMAVAVIPLGLARRPFGRLCFGVVACLVVAGGVWCTRAEAAVTPLYEPAPSEALGGGRPVGCGPGGEERPCI